MQSTSSADPPRQAPEYNLFDFLKMKRPYIVGSDICGIVEEVGSEVKDYKTGDEVFGAFELVNQGAFAEYAVIDVNFIIHKPHNITFTEAAGVPLSSLTAGRDFLKYWKYNLLKKC